MPRRLLLPKFPEGRKPIARGTALGSLSNNAPGAEQVDLPEGWGRVPFSDAIRKKKARVAKVRQSDYRKTGRFPVIDQGQQQVAGYWDNEANVYRGELPVIVFGDHTRVFKFVDFPFVVGADGTHVLVPNKKFFDAFFLYFALSHLYIPSRGYNRHFGLLREHFIVAPPLAEQRAIADLLRTLQRAKEATEKAIAATHQLKASVMKHLFTYGPVPFDESDKVPLRETEIGRIPEHWYLLKLGEIAEMHTGGTPSRSNPAFWNGGIPWVKTGEVNYNIIHRTEETISEEGLKRSAAKLTPPGTLLVAMYGQGVTRGRVAILGFEAALNQACAAVFPKETVTKEFLYSVFVHSYERIRNMGHGAHQKNLSITLLEQVLIPVPPLPEQRQIAEKLAAVDAKQAAEEKRRAVLAALFQSLLHRLMTGNLRLPEFARGKV